MGPDGKLRWPVSLALLAGLAGCSALIDADTDKLGGARLGGADAGGLTGSSADAGVDPCAAGCVAGERCNPARGCVPIACRNDLDCNDDNACNGVETCAPGANGADTQTGCIAGVAQNCDDFIACTIDSCTAAAGCVHTANDTLCDDGVSCSNDVCNQAATAGTDGCAHTPDNTQCGFCHADGVCSLEAGGCVGSVPTNCSDGDFCTGDTCDDARRMCVNGVRDDDGDGYALDVCGGGDCADDNPAVHPDAVEVCDGYDDNCDGVVDDGCVKLPDTCGSAQTVTLVSGRATVTGALSDFDSNYGTTCGQSQGRDAVYAIAVSGTSDIVIDSNGSDARVVLALAERVCSDANFAFACAGSITDNGRRTRLMLHGYTPNGGSGMLYLLVDGASGSETGAFSISIEVTPAKSDACSDVFELGAGGTVVGFISNLVGQQRGTCQGPTGQGQPEAIMHMVGPVDKSVEVSVTSNDFAPVLYARSACTPALRTTEYGCETSGDNNGGPLGGQSATADFNFEARTNSDVYIFVDGALVGGSYTLTCVP